MEIRLGVIGPEDSVKHILSSAELFAAITLLPFPYTNIEQVDEIIHKNRVRSINGFSLVRFLIHMPDPRHWLICVWGFKIKELYCHFTYSPKI
ncbi:hypothetical protein ACJROX_28670 [Pseudalkalibacillus sp. A8]|uniref:hypothetical protein n=1 Tax=Pseudalkalibacillus sp. A8 TaxID=3382641 RepID=UPI0038B53A94